MITTTLCLFVFRGRVSLCNSSGCPGTHLVDQAGLELTEIHLPLPPRNWEYSDAPPLPSLWKATLTKENI